MQLLVNVMPKSPCLHVFKTQTSQVVTQAASSRARIVPLKMGFEDREETVSEATKRYEPIEIPYRTVTAQVVARQAGSRIEVVPGSLKTATESVMIKPAGKQIIAVPAVCETVTEQVLVAGKSSEWKCGKAWLSQATMVRPVKSFLNDKGEVTAAAAVAVAGAGAGAGGNAKLSAETAESLKAKGGAKLPL